MKNASQLVSRLCSFVATCDSISGYSQDSFFFLLPHPIQTLGAYLWQVEMLQTRWRCADFNIYWIRVYYRCNLGRFWIWTTPIICRISMVWCFFWPSLLIRAFPDRSFPSSFSQSFSLRTHLLRTFYCWLIKNNNQSISKGHLNQ